MSVSELTGIIKLSNRQAEGRRISSAVLCLKYILSVAASLFFFMLWTVEYNGDKRIVFIACSAGSAIVAVVLRSLLIRETYLISESFLRCGSEGEPVFPDIPALVSGEAVYLSVVCTVGVILLSPSYVCFASGLKYYSLSSDRELFMLLTAASILLAAGGIIFFSVIKARLGCTRYLWLSGHCDCIPAAMDCSWELTRGSGGDILCLGFLSLFGGISLRFLSSMNLSQKLLRQKGMPDEKGLCVSIITDRRGEQQFEFF